MTNIDYEDQIAMNQEEKQQALTDAEATYGGMIDEAQKYYQSQIDASKEWASTQQNIQQAQTDFTIDQIEQQKEQAGKDYTKEQSGAYTDYKKESNRYGAGAEEMAAAGLSGTGYSESSQVSMYNEYQNRVATARASYNQAVMNYNNAIKEAQLQNSSALAEIAYTAFQQQLEFSLQGFQYENQLIFALDDRKNQIEDTYHTRYLDVLDQMNADRAFEEGVRQYNQNYELQKKEYEEGVRRYEAELERLKKLDEQENELNIQELELKKAQLEEEKRQFDLMYEQSGLGITKNEETTNSVIEAGANAAVSAAKNQVVSGYYPGKTATNKEITDFIEKIMPEAGKNIKSSYQQKLANDEEKLHSGVQQKTVGTEYYEGPLNSDAETFGTFKNGYQPKGISGHGKLEKTGDTFSFYTTKQYGSQAGRTVKVTQNLWRAEDGTLWYWNGKENAYKTAPIE